MPRLPLRHPAAVQMPERRPFPLGQATPRAPLPTGGSWPAWPSPASQRFAQLYSTQAVLPIIAQELQVTAAEAALTISLATVGLAVTVLPWSFLADRIGRVRAMAWGISAATVLGLLAPLAPSFPVLLGLRMSRAWLWAASRPSPSPTSTRKSTRPMPHWRPAPTLLAPRSRAGGTARRRTGRRTVGLACRGAGCFPHGDRRGRAVPGPGAAGAQLHRCCRASGFRGALATLAGHGRNPRLLAIYVQAFVLMGGFVAVYNYLGFRLSGEPFSLPATLISLIFLDYLSGTVSPVGPPG